MERVQRLSFLDSLRGLAALGVVLAHFIGFATAHFGLPGLFEPLALGTYGVPLFFVISGFSLCMTMPLHERTGHALTSFYLHRFFRIAPLFYVVLVFTCLRDHLWPGVALPIGDVLLNITFLFTLVPGKEDSIVHAGWTIGAEMLFYLIFPLLYWLMPRLRTKLLVLLIAVAIITVVHHIPWLYGESRHARSVAIVTRTMPLFLAGMVAFDLWQRLRGWPWQRGLLLLGIAAAIFWCRQEVPRAGTLLEGMGFAMLLLGAAILSSRLLVNRVWSFYGEISYSVYLWHLPVMIVLVPTYRDLLALIGPGVPLFCAALALTLVVLTGVSWLSSRYIELPGIALGKQVLAAATARRRLAKASS